MCRPLVVGIGELGKPLFSIVKNKYPKSEWLDVTNRFLSGNFDILHIAYPCYNQSVFVKQTCSYVERFRPKLVLIESTVAVGTTRLIYKSLYTRIRFKIVHSPIRGNVREGMERGIKHYTKCIGAIDQSSGEHAKKYYKSLGLKTFMYKNSETSELAKLWETTYFGIMIATFQEILRESKQCGADFEGVIHFLHSTQEESRTMLGKGKYHPRPVMYPGYIGGHCVIPNAKILASRFGSKLITGVLESNELRKQELGDEVLKRHLLKNHAGRAKGKAIRFVRKL